MTTRDDSHNKEKTMTRDEKKEMILRKPVAMGSRGVTLHDFDSLQRFAAAAVGSGYFQSARNVAQAVVKIQYGLEIGLPPIAAMRGIFMFDGNLGLYASTMGALIKKHPKYDYRVALATSSKCVLKWFEDGEEIGESDFSIQEANQAGLSGKKNWTSYPKHMLFARALSTGARWFTPDIFSGAVYTAEEIMDGVRAPDMPTEEDFVVDAQQAFKESVDEDEEKESVDAEFTDAEAAEEFIEDQGLSRDEDAVSAAADAVFAEEEQAELIPESSDGNDKLKQRLAKAKRK